MTDDEARANDLVHQHNEYVSDHVCSLACREAAILSALADARRAALEEAAKFADEESRRLLDLQREAIREGQWATSDVYGARSYGASEIANQLRALATRKDA